MPSPFLHHYLLDIFLQSPKKPLSPQPELLLLVLDSEGLEHPQALTEPSPVLPCDVPMEVTDLPWVGARRGEPSHIQSSGRSDSHLRGETPCPASVYHPRVGKRSGPAAGGEGGERAGCRHGAAGRCAEPPRHPWPLISSQLGIWAATPRCPASAVGAEAGPGWLGGVRDCPRTRGHQAGCCSPGAAWRGEPKTTNIAE